ncbi:mannose-6-phosphate isomerase [Hysterangium stoloniferum]|nr:mannose-6-phosphate isomerase [Hysterangium stoloniferum]
MSPQPPEDCELDFEVNESKSYADMWMGTHPKGPSTLYDHHNTWFASLLAIDTEYFLGPRTISKFPITSDKESNKRSPEIPYLFKVLSIAKALPLQTHPNKKTRRETDADPIKSIVSSLLLRARSEIESFVRAVVDRLQTQNDAFSKLVLEVNSQYPGVVSVLMASFLMNLVTPSKGEAVYIGADDAHAYLSGDIIEHPCIFTEMLTYAPRPAETLGIPSTPYKGSTRGRTTAYDPPLGEFTVLHTSLDPHYNEEQLQPAPGPTTGIVLEGEVHITTAADKEGIYLKARGVIFVAAAQKFQLHAVARGPTEIFWSTVIV